MAVVSTPPSMSSVISVFGGPGNLTAYYRGGPYVPNTTQNAAISTTPGGLALSQFAGANTYVPVSASVNSTTANGTVSSNTTTATVTSSPNTVASGSGGSGTYTFSWVFVSGDNTVTVTASTSSTTTFTASVSDPSGVGVTKSAVYRCTVSDGTTSANTPNVSVSLTHNKIGP